MFIQTLLASLLVTPLFSAPAEPMTNAAPEPSDCQQVRIKWQNKTGNSVKVVGYALGVAGKLITRTPQAEGRTFEARTGETWTSGNYLFEGIDGMDVSAVHVLYYRWRPAQGTWSQEKFRAVHTPGHPTCTDGKIYQTVKLSLTDDPV